MKSLNNLTFLYVSALLLTPHISTSAYWPMFSGPDGNFSIPESGFDLVDSWDDVTFLWESEEDDIDDAKCCYDVKDHLNAGWKFHPGGQAHPIVANDMVFVSHYKPTGELAVNSSIRLVPSIEELDSLSGRPEDLYGILADDIVVAIDISTGKTKWKVVEESKGINHVQTKRPGYGVAPVWHDGRVYSMGTAGRLYCYSDQDGVKEWETTVPGLFEYVAEETIKALDEKKLVKSPRMLTSLLVAENKIICPHFSNGAVSGVNPENGEFEWTVEDVLASFSSPALFHSDNYTYVLCQNGKGVMTLIDPKDGEVKWSVTGLGTMLFTPIPSNNHVIVSAEPSEGKTTGFWAGYTLSPEAASKAWEKPDYRFGWWNDDGAGRKMAVKNNRYYFALTRKNDNDPFGVYVLDENDGGTLQTIPSDSIPEASGWFAQPMAIEDRLVVFTDYRHGASSFDAILFSIAEDGKLTKLDYGHPFNNITTGYEVDLQPAYAGGRFYFRTEDGRVAAYDLRTNVSAERSHDAAPSNAVAGIRQSSLVLTTKGLEVHSLSGRKGIVRKFDLKGRRIDIGKQQTAIDASFRTQR